LYATSLLLTKAVLPVSRYFGTANSGAMTPVFTENDVMPVFNKEPANDKIKH
jgi:hypothetical protein